MLSLKPAEGPGITNQRQLPLTAAQNEICIGQQFDPDSPLYNMGMVFSISGELDVDLFLQAWNSIVQHNDALRIQLHMANGETTQSSSNQTISTLQLDFSHSCEAMSEAREWIQTNLETPIQLTESLVESTLIKLSSTSWMWFCKQHHIITDATSFSSIWSLLVDFYTSAKSTHNSTSKTQYLDYVEYQLLSATDEQATSKHSLEKSMQYWSTKALPPSPHLYGRKPSFTNTSAKRHSDFFSSSYSKELESLIHQTDIRSISPHLARFQVLVTVLFAFLYRVSGQSSLTIATTAPNRANPDIAQTPGLFVELLPLVIDMDKNETFASLLSKVKLETLNFMKHAMPGASNLVNGREISAVLNYVPLTMDDLDGMPIIAEWLHPQHIDRQHAFRLHATDWNNTGQITLALDTNDSCFSDSQALSAQQHWLALFEAFAQDRSKIINEISIVDRDSQNRSDQHHLTDSSQSAFPKSKNDSLIHRFESVAEQYAESIALIDGQTQISYSTLSERINTLVNGMKCLDLGESSKIAIILPRSMSVAVAMLSSSKLGATYIPIEANNPLNRIHYLLEDCQPNLVICDLPLSTTIQSTSPKLILNSDGTLVKNQNTELDNNTLKPEQLDTWSNQNSPAYILYTSGTTGQPKGVIVSRSAMMNYVDWAVDYYTRGKPLSFAFFTPISFDLTLTSLFVPLLSGGKIHIYPDQNNTADNSLFSVVKDNKVDILKLTPTHLSMLQQHDLSNSKVSQIIVGGEDLKCSLAQTITAALNNDVIIHNEYGPTEATVGCIVHRFNRNVDLTGSVPIGKPVAGMQLAVLNSEKEYQPDGVVGTLHISGPSLADGYLNNIQQTNKYFSTLHHGKSIFYNTGDLVRVNSAGQLVYIGREDDQHKIRGARIELSEIESVALSHSTITSCVVAPILTDATTHLETEVLCARCGISSHYPEASIEDNGICNLCTAFDTYKYKAQSYFKHKKELISIADSLKERSTSKYDCMMLLSGGKDSSYALAQLVDLGLSVLAYTLDNGYISTGAKTNIKQVCHALNVDHEFATTPAMRKIFSESLEKYSNVCNGCFKTIYTLSMQRAQQLNISGIFTGLSRGQFFETRLTQELFCNSQIDNKQIDATVLSARKAYHRTNDAVSQLLNTEQFQNDAIFEQVEIYDFYRYSDVGLNEMLSYLQSRLPWVRPKDTGRSTNCLINDTGIYVHKKERGYHNYSLPYSWDVRLGHKQREEAIDELNDDINVEEVHKILEELNYTPRNSIKGEEKRLALYYTASSHLSSENVKEYLSSLLPEWLRPSWYIQLDELPRSDNGKVSKSALPEPSGQRQIEATGYVKPRTEIEKKITSIWARLLKIDRIGIHDNFFELGGDSLLAIRIAAIMNESGFRINSAELFEYQTVSQIAKRCIQLRQSKIGVSEERISNDSPAAFSSLNSSQLHKLGSILSKKKETSDSSS